MTANRITSNSVSQPGGVRSRVAPAVPNVEKGSRRIIALDSLRGLAALIVVFHHLDNTLDLDGSNKVLGPILHHSPLRLLWMDARQ